jgi:hypothetical protein
MISLLKIILYNLNKIQKVLIKNFNYKLWEFKKKIHKINKK